MDRPTIYSALVFTCGAHAVRAALIEDGVMGDGEDYPMPIDLADDAMFGLYADFLADEDDATQAMHLDACAAKREVG